jgi:hypothetical protein
LATKLNTDKVADAITPLVTKVANDPELREHAKTVLDSARSVYLKVQADGARDAVTDKRVREEVIKASGSIKEGARRLSEPPKRKRRGRAMMKLVLGAALAAGAVISIRRALGGDEDEFEYQP